MDFFSYLNPFSGKNPITGQHGLGLFGGPLGAEGLQNPGAAPPLPEYQNLKNPDGTPYTPPGTAQAAAPEAAIAQRMGDPRFGQLDQSGLNRPRDLAFGQGDTGWGALMKQQNGLQTANARDAAERGSASSTQSAVDALSMNGGITGGSRERLAGAGIESRNQALQGVTRDSMGRDLQIGIQDQSRRDAAASALPGQQLAAAGFDQNNAGIQNSWDAANTAAQNNFSQFNASNQNANNQFNAGLQQQGNQFGATQAMTEAQRRSNFDQQNYQSQAGIYGGIAQGNSTIQAAAAGKDSGSSFICTELRRQGLMSVKESKRMLDFMLRGLNSRADFFLWYFSNGEMLIKACLARGQDWESIKPQFVDEIIALVKADKEVEAQDAYIKAVELLNICHGHVMGKMPKSLYGHGKLKHFIAFPQLFLLPSTWRWLNGFTRSQVERKVRKLTRRYA
jgi:hypothetical protein